MMTTETGSTTSASDRELVFERVFDASRELVFEAWTDPRHVGAWWGPNGFTTTTHEMEVRPGGVWRFIMHGPDGTDYPNKIVYREVVRPERLVYDHSDDDGTDGVSFVVTATFTDEAGKTRLVMRMLFPTAEELRKVAEYAEPGANETLERLRQHLARM